MSVPFSIVSRKNPSRPDAPKKFYANAQASGVNEFGEICETIADRGTCIAGDVMATLEGLIHSMLQGLRAGRIIRLGDFGSFQISLKSGGAATEQEFNASLIKGARICFRPGFALANMLKTVQYQSVPKLPVKVKKPVQAPVE